MPLKVDIVSAEGEIYSGEAAMVFAPAKMGEVGIAPRHAPLLTNLKPGSIRVETTEGEGWKRTRFDPLVPVEGDTEGKRYEGLPPGRYRMTEPRSKESSHEVQVQGGGEPTILTWWLGTPEYVEGDVALPPGIDPKGLMVMAWTVTKFPRLAGRGTLDGTHFSAPTTR